MTKTIKRVPNDILMDIKAMDLMNPGMLLA